MCAAASAAEVVISPADQVCPNTAYVLPSGGSDDSLLMGIVSLNFLLQHHELLIPLVESGGERDHDVSLLQQQLLEAACLQLLLSRRLSLSFKLPQPRLVLTTYPLVLLCQQRPASQGHEWQGPHPMARAACLTSLSGACQWTR